MHEVLAYFAVYGWIIIIQTFPTDVAEFSFMMYLFGPTVCDRVLNQACRDAGAGRDDGLETAVVHHEVTHFADVPLLYEAPEHVRAAMAVRRFVKRFLTEAVPMAGWSLGRDRRHIPRSTAEPFTPDFHREATQGAPRDDDNNIITRPTLRDLGTVHNCAAAAAAAMVVTVMVMVVVAVVVVVVIVAVVVVVIVVVIVVVVAGRSTSRIHHTSHGSHGSHRRTVVVVPS